MAGAGTMSRMRNMPTWAASYSNKFRSRKRFSKLIAKTLSGSNCLTVQMLNVSHSINRNLPMEGDE